MSTINERLSDLFVLIKVGKYDELLSQIMSRIKREMDLESCRNPQPWYPFAYQHTPSDLTLRSNLEKWKIEYGEVPPRIDVLFCPVDEDYYEWEESCKHRIPARPDIDMSKKTVSWKHMNRPVDGTLEVPHHFDVWGMKKRYYALIIENLELYPFDRMETLTLAYCRTYPKGVRIGRTNTVNLWRKDTDIKEATIDDLSILGRAVLREPYAVELRRSK